MPRLRRRRAMREQAGGLVGSDPDRRGRDGVAAELTNSLVPRAVGTLPELQRAGIHHAK